MSTGEGTSQPSDSCLSQARSRPPLLPRTLVPPYFVSDPSVVQEWRYESRRLAQQIDSHLWLGPMSSARDKQFLTDNGISMTLAVTTLQAGQIIVSRLQNKEDHRLLPVTTLQDLVRILPEAIDLIQHVRDRGSSLLLYCETGNEKSAAVAVAYIMSSTGWDLIRSIQFVQSKRYCVALDEPTKFHLQAFEMIIRAQGQVSSSPSRKADLRRTIDDLYESSDSSSDVREGIAPFVDVNEVTFQGTDAAMI
ncbi:protein-tyrosine phosphatase-like protein [Lipomyces japonicus]|uniref:protein-tyrosine phosphatase-like protein n=1 Tax=Lipomyces japonicus TaxID=56871 RepID=UPI0034CD2D8F